MIVRTPYRCFKEFLKAYFTFLCSNMLKFSAFEVIASRILLSVKHLSYPLYSSIFSIKQYKNCSPFSTKMATLLLKPPRHHYGIKPSIHLKTYYCTTLWRVSLSASVLCIGNNGGYHKICAEFGTVRTCMCTFVCICIQGGEGGWGGEEGVRGFLYFLWLEYRIRKLALDL
jgi:hypothetical protein